MRSSPFLGKNFLLGIGLQILALALFYPVTDYFYYGGGWPFVPFIFATIYAVGIRYVFKSDIPYWLKLILSFWWLALVIVLIVAAVLSE